MVLQVISVERFTAEKEGCICAGHKNNYYRLSWLGMFFRRVLTRMDPPKYGETLKFMYIKYQLILVVLPKVYQIELRCNQNNL